MILKRDKGLVLQEDKMRNIDIENQNLQLQI